jgi:spermidine/putrescine transport system permease protein
VGAGEKAERPGVTPTQDPAGRLTRRSSDRTQHRLFWAALAAPGIIWLAVLFIVPFYAIVAIAGGQVDVFGNPVAVWNPLHWSSMNFSAAWRDVAGASAFVGPILLRTLVYVALASLISLLIAYPAAYFVARFAGRRKALFLILLIAPFWISYMMRMLAWIGLLQTNGYVNKALISLHLISQPVDWLGGLGITVVLGLVYGYIPYLILVLYAGLDRIDPALIEAGRDLGLGRVRTFVRVTLPMSRQAILTGMLITVLPMLGDYFTNQLLSGTTGTTMLGNVIDDQLTSSGGVLEGQGAVFSLLFLLVLIAPMIYYVVATNRSSRAAT